MSILRSTGHRRARCHLATAAAIALCALGARASAATAQRVVVTVVDQTTHDAIGGAVVTLMAADSTAPIERLTDAEGRAALIATHPGRFSLRDSANREAAVHGFRIRPRRRRDETRSRGDVFAAHRVAARCHIRARERLSPR